MGGTRGTVISEPSIIATDTKQEKVVAVGDEAARLVLRMPDMWRPLTPLKDGFIVDYRVMHTMLNYFLNKVSNALRRARVLVGVPCGMTDVEQEHDGCCYSGWSTRSISYRTTCRGSHWLRCTYL